MRGYESERTADIVRARRLNGLSPICCCERCGDELFYGDEIYDFDGDIYCVDCARDYFDEHSKSLGDEYLEMGRY